MATQVVYHASDIRHGLFADLRKIVEWHWLADEVPGVEVAVRSEKYDPDRADVSGLLHHVGANNPTCREDADGGRISEKFSVDRDFMADLFGIDAPEKPIAYDRVFHVNDARVSDDQALLAELGLNRDSLLWLELQNTPDRYRPSPLNQRIRNIYNRQFNELVSLSQPTRELIETTYQDNLADAEHVIGVHVRFSRHYLDLNLGSRGGYYKNIVDDIGSWMKRHDREGSTIYLATHLNDLVRLTSRIWGDDLVARDIARNAHDEDFHLVDETLATQLQDAIVDCWMLSRCDVLLGGVSNLAYTSMVINPDLPFHFLNSMDGSRGG
jgi:hypothetical protein